MLYQWCLCVRITSDSCQYYYFLIFFQQDLACLAQTTVQLYLAYSVVFRFIRSPVLIYSFQSDRELMLLYVILVKFQCFCVQPPVTDRVVTFLCRIFTECYNCDFTILLLFLSLQKISFYSWVLLHSKFTFVQLVKLLFKLYLLLCFCFMIKLFSDYLYMYFITVKYSTHIIHMLTVDVC